MSQFLAQGNLVVGVAVGLSSTCLQGIGLTLQRMSHILEDEKCVNSPPRPVYKRQRWQIGMLLFLVANIFGSCVQITTLPLPVLSTLQASGLAFNSIFASLLLNEPFTRFSFIGTILVFIGAALIALFGPVSDPAHNLEQLIHLFSRQQFLLWFSSTFAFTALILFSIYFLKRNTTWQAFSRRKTLVGMLYGVICGILSAHTLLLAKLAVELINRTILDKVNQFIHWQSWMVVIGLVSLALTQLFYLQSALRLVSTSILYPFVFCIYNFITILDGLVYFKQTARLAALETLLLVIGTSILLIGVLILSWRRESSTSNGSSPLSETREIVCSCPDAGSFDESCFNRPPLNPDSELSEADTLIEAGQDSTYCQYHKPCYSSLRTSKSSEFHDYQGQSSNILQPYSPDQVNVNKMDISFFKKLPSLASSSSNIHHSIHSAEQMPLLTNFTSTTPIDDNRHTLSLSGLSSPITGSSSQRFSLTAFPFKMMSKLRSEHQPTDHESRRSLAISTKTGSFDERAIIEAINSEVFNSEDTSELNSSGISTLSSSPCDNSDSREPQAWGIPSLTGLLETCSQTCRRVLFNTNLESSSLTSSNSSSRASSLELPSRSPSPVANIT